MVYFILKFSTHCRINFLPKTASFWCNMKWAQKALCVAAADSSVLQILSTANGLSALVKCVKSTGKLHWVHRWNVLNALVKCIEAFDQCTGKNVFSALVNCIECTSQMHYGNWSYQKKKQNISKMNLQLPLVETDLHLIGDSLECGRHFWHTL